MPRALKPCSRPGCPELVASGRCPDCQADAQARRGTRHQRGYGIEHTNRFRPEVLRRDPLCVCTDPTITATHQHGGQCLAPSTVADHHPLSKRELQALGLDDNDPDRGRGLCKACHDLHTSQAQPGGWNAR